MSLPNGHFSPSSINQLLRCKTQYEWRYVKGVKIPPGWAVVKGIALDRACQTDLVAKMEHGENLSEDSLYEVMTKEVESKINDIDPYDPEVEEAGGPEKVIEKFVADSPQIIGAIKPWLNSYEPTGVQKEVGADVGGYPTVGVLDARDAGKISDTKMATRRKGETAGETSNQLRLYQIIERRRGDPVPGGAELVSVYPLTKSYKVQVLPQSVDIEAENRMESLVNTLGRGVEAGLFEPVNLDGPNAWVCSRKFCGYWGICKYGERGRSR